MNFQVPISVCAITISLFAGTTIAAEANSTNQFPDAIASHGEMFKHDIAEKMFMQLPLEHQTKIAEAGGIGSENFDADAFAFENDAPPLLEVDPGITAHEYLEMIVSDSLAKRMTQEQWNILNAIADTLDDGKSVPHMCFAPDTDREYAYAVNQLIEFNYQVRFQQTARWSSTATNGGGLGQGTPTTLTYSFVPDGTFIPNGGIGLGSGNSQLFAWLDGVYGNTQDWQDMFHLVFDRWEELIGTTYVHELNDDGSNTNNASGVLGVRGDVRIGAFNYANDGNGGVLAYNYFPNDGDMIFDAFDTFYNVRGNNSRRLRNVAAHEHGHGLGMLHVCPASGTKLMEPFISTAYDGPQLDDTLNGIRHYGDNNEPDNSIAQATDLGDLNVGGASAVTNVGVDDNTDNDYFRVGVTEPARILFAVAPDAATYSQGSQTSQCNTGTSTNYNSVQNLRITAVDAGGNTLGTANNTGFGDVESLTIDLTSGGDEVFFVVDGATNVNSVQRYQVSVLVVDIPFMGPLLSADVPETVDPGTPSTFEVSIDPREDTIVDGSELIFVSVNGAAFIQSALIETGLNTYSAELPAVDCGDTVGFYLSVTGQTNGTGTLPRDGASDPFVAVVGQFENSFYDDFEGNMGWIISGDVIGRNNGRWERGEPNGDGSLGEPAVDADGSGSCFQTGNGNPGSNTDVDDGQTILNSPIFDLSSSPESFISYNRWFDNTGAGNGGSPNEDVFTVQVSNNAGIDWTTVEIVGPDSSESEGGWFDVSFRVADYVTPTNAVLLRFIAEDAGDPSVVEAAVDGISVDNLACEDPSTCLADLNGDGALNFFDVSAFLSAFSNGDLVADFTGDGDLNFFDVSAFLTAFSAGCP